MTCNERHVKGFMENFAERLKKHLEQTGHSLYKICMSIGIDHGNTKKILYGERTTTFEKRLEVVQKLATSPLMELDIETMVAWLALDYLPKDVILKAAHEVQEEVS